MIAADTDNARPSQAPRGGGRARQAQLLTLSDEGDTLKEIEKKLNKLKLAPLVNAALTSEKIRDLMLPVEDESSLAFSQMSKIVKNDHAANTITSLTKTLIKSLRKNGFTTDQISTIAGNNGAHGVLTWLADADNLRKLTRDSENKELFTIEQIVKIAGNKGAHGVLTWLADADNLRKLTRDSENKELFTTEQIVKIAGNDGAHGVLQWLAEDDNLRKLTRDSENKELFTTEQIVKIAGNIGADGALKWLAEADNLRKLTHDNKGQPLFTIEQIVKIAGNDSAHGVLKWLAEADNLRKLTRDSEDKELFTIAQITTIAGNNGAHGVLQWLAEDDNLRKLTRDSENKELFTIEQIVKIAGNGGAHGVLKWLAEADNLRTLTRDSEGKERFTTAQIVTFAGNGGAYGVLQWLAEDDNLRKLTRDSENKELFTTEQIVKIAGNEGARGVLQWLTKSDNLRKLTHDNKGQPLFNIEQITTIASYGGASKTLHAITALHWDATLTKDEVVALVSRNSGSGVLSWVLEHQDRLPKTQPLRYTFLAAACSKTKDARKKALAIADASNADASTSSGVKRTALDSPGPSKHVKLKQEPLSSDPALQPIEGMEIDEVNTAQTRIVPTTTHRLFDLTGDDGTTVRTLTLRHVDQTRTINVKQTYDPALDKVFPIRDPAHPNEVHPWYADSTNKRLCSTEVKVTGVRLTKAYEDQLWNALSNFESRVYTDKKMFIAAFKRSCLLELTSTLRGGKPPSCASVSVITMEEKHCRPQDKALIGQYGVTLTNYEEQHQPSIRNARPMGFFAGSRLESEEDRAKYRATFGKELGDEKLKDYGVDIPKRGTTKTVTYAPFGGGDKMQYANAPFKPASDGSLVVDTDRVNAGFIPVTFDVTDNCGNPRTETLPIVVQYRPIPEGQPVELDYGDNYRLVLNQDDAMDVDLSAIKLEHA